MRYAARDVWAQFELLLLQQRVLYIKSAAHTTQAKLRMVVPKQLVEQALVEVHDGVAGAHLGGMQSLMKIKARFQRPGTTKEVHCYCNRCLTCAKCKPRGKPRALLWSFTSGNPMQHMSQKNSDLVFCWKTLSFELHSTENIFWLVGNEIKLLCNICTKTVFTGFGYLTSKTR